MRMRAKEYLLQLQKIDRVIENKEIEKQQWKEIATSITVQTNGERVQSSGKSDKIANAVARYVDIDKEIDAEIDRYIDLKREIINTLEQLDATDYDLLHKIYVQGMELKLAAYSMGKSESWGSSAHGRALQRLDVLLNGRYRNEQK